ncbi:DUF6508 domain-containing protein [Bacillus sp. DJP31]
MSTADIDLLRSILTFYVRRERFWTGAWESAAKEKVFLNILLRLKQVA